MNPPVTKDFNMTDGSDVDDVEPQAEEKESPDDWDEPESSPRYGDDQ